MLRHLAAATALAGTLLAGGCTLPPPRLDAERQWREAIADLGMVAIYPASEDVMVGDAFLFVPGAQNFDLVRVTSAPPDLLAEQFCWQEQDRPSLDSRPFPGREASAGQPAVASDRGGASGHLVCPSGTPAAGGTPVRRQDLRRIAPFDVPVAAHHMTRLREEAIPTLEVGRFSQGEVAGGITSGNFALALGFGGSAASGVRIELRHLQSATLEELRASRLIESVLIARYRRAGRGGEDFANALTPLMLARSLLYADHRNGTSLSRSFCGADFIGLNRTGARIVLANRVLYAGGIGFDFLSESVAATRVALDAAAVLAGRTQPTGLPDFNPGQGGQGGGQGGGGQGGGGQGGGGQGVGGQGGNQAATGADALRGETARLMGTVNNILTLPPGGPGQARARLSVGRFGNLTLEREFARPAAVGMGAALHFPIPDVAVPVNEAQINEALAFCSLEHDVGPQARQALERRLRIGLDWVRFLADEGGQRSGAARQPVTARPEGTLPPLPPLRQLRLRP